jgi:hypothetical protein
MSLLDTREMRELAGELALGGLKRYPRASLDGAYPMNSDMVESAALSEQL